MTDTYAHTPDTMEKQIKELERRLRALETAPRATNTSIQDGSLRVLDADRRPHVVIGKQDDGTYGIRVLDDDGTVQVILGELGASDFGLAVRAANGLFEAITGSVFQGVQGPLTYSSASLGALPGGPTVTFQAGTYGGVYISLGAEIEPGNNVAGANAQLAIALNGDPGDPTLFASARPSSTDGVTCFAEFATTGLTPGADYAVTVVARCGAGGVTATFRDVTLKAVPI